MGSSSDQIAREIKQTREEMEENILTLRRRGQAAVRRSRRVLLIALGAGAAVGAAVVLGIVAYRMTRPPTMRERVERVIPATHWEKLRSLQKSLELGVRRQVPPVRMYVGDRQVGEEPPSTRFEKIGLQFAGAAGTAIGGAIVARILERFRGKAA